MVEVRAQEKWYFKNSTILVAFIAVGPLALPLVWFNPRYSRSKKIVITLATAVITYFLSIAMVHSVQNILKYYSEISAPL